MDESTSLQDDLAYKYYDFSNKLKNVDGTETENYTYDQIGNLIGDNAEGIDSIAWTPYGKVRAVFKDDNSQVHFRYDAAGNRIAKITESDTTYYVRDASGIVMGVYKNDTLAEQSIYGSSRLGLVNYASKTGYRSLGGKKYELSNHLGNVLAVVTDNIHLDQDSTWTSVVNVTDYYPFGLAMDGRTVQDSSYRYGFNGKELIEDFNLNIYSYEFRSYDPVIGRWWQIDPIIKENMSGYSWVTNNPIRYYDILGLDSAQRNSAIQIALEFVSKNTNPSSASYGINSNPQPGESCDCSGLIKAAVMAGGESNPNIGNNDYGTQNIVENTEIVQSLSLLQEGNLIFFNTVKGR